MALDMCPGATFTLELPDGESSVGELMKLVDN